MPSDGISWDCVWTIEKFDAEGQLYDRVVVPGNLGVSAGLALLIDLLIGAGGTAFSNANARIGVGDSSTAAAIGQTDLQAATNKLRKAMEATFPSRAGSVVSWKSSFAPGEASWAWNEWCVANSASGATILNRKVQSLGTKPAGDTWTIQADITFS